MRQYNARASREEQAAVEYRTLSSELLVDAPVLAVRRDRITTATGEAVREVVEHFSAVAIVAVRASAQGGSPEVMLVRQYRRPVDRYLWELPAGLLDVTGETPSTRRGANWLKRQAWQPISGICSATCVRHQGSARRCAAFSLLRTSGPPPRTTRGRGRRRSVKKRI